MTPALRTAVAEQRERVNALQKTLHAVIPFVFPHLKGTDPRTADRKTRQTILGTRRHDFYLAWAAACRKAGVAGWLLHDFRRRAVRNLVASGVSQKVAMTVTGHKTRTVFDRYRIVSLADLQQASEKLATLGAFLGTTAWAQQAA